MENYQFEMDHCAPNGKNFNRKIRFANNYTGING